MRIIGVDPGLKATGYGVIDIADTAAKRLVLLECGTIEPRKSEDVPRKLAKIYRHLRDVIAQHSPNLMVLEKLYSHHQYPTTAFILGHVRGVISLLCADCHLQLVEYSVKRVRKSLLGQGNATKQQAQKMVAQIFGVNMDQLSLDASDALALAVGYARMQKFSGGLSGKLGTRA